MPKKSSRFAEEDLDQIRITPATDEEIEQRDELEQQRKEIEKKNDEKASSPRNP